MPWPLSNDLRKRIIIAKNAGDTISKIAREKNVSESAVFRICKLYNETGSYTPRPMKNGRKPQMTPKQFEQVREKIIEKPDIPLLELIDELCFPISESALCRIVNNKLGLRRKKRFLQQNKIVKM